MNRISSALMGLVLAMLLLAGRAFHHADATAASQRAPSFTAVTLDGRPLSSTSLKGKAYIVNFFASWCPPCRTEIPDMVALQKVYEKEGFTFVGVAVNESEPNIRSFMQKNGITYPVIMVTQELVDAYGRHVDGGLNGIPTSFVINSSGMLTGVIIGPKNREAFDQIIRTAIGRKVAK